VPAHNPDVTASRARATAGPCQHATVPPQCCGAPAVPLHHRVDLTCPKRRTTVSMPASPCRRATSPCRCPHHRHGAPRAFEPVPNASSCRNPPCQHTTVPMHHRAGAPQHRAGARITVSSEHFHRAGAPSRRTALASVPSRRCTPVPAHHHGKRHRDRAPRCTRRRCTTVSARHRVAPVTAQLCADSPSCAAPPRRCTTAPTQKPAPVSAPPVAPSGQDPTVPLSHRAGVLPCRCTTLPVHAHPAAPS
jgi:hypothetical protein